MCLYVLVGVPSCLLLCQFVCVAVSHGALSIQVENTSAKIIINLNEVTKPEEVLTVLSMFNKNSEYFRLLWENLTIGLLDNTLMMPLQSKGTNYETGDECDMGNRTQRKLNRYSDILVNTEQAILHIGSMNGIMACNNFELFRVTNKKRYTMKCTKSLFNGCS